MYGMNAITILSESALAVTFGNSIDLETHRRVMAFRNALLMAPFPGLLDVVPAYATVTVFFDPVAVKKHFPENHSPVGTVYTILEKQWPDPGSPPHPQITGSTNHPVNPSTNPQIPDSTSHPINHSTNHHIPDSTNHPVLNIPVRYNGPDLSEVAERLGLSAREVIERHSGPVYTVFMTGFLPGFPYLGPLPEALELPRRDAPRLRVPAGSVAIAGRQTGIYPQASPGGWHLIGHTEVPLFNPAVSTPALLQPGMQVRFMPLLSPIT